MFDSQGVSVALEPPRGEEQLIAQAHVERSRLGWARIGRPCFHDSTGVNPREAIIAPRRVLPKPREATPSELVTVTAAIGNHEHFGGADVVEQALSPKSFTQGNGPIASERGLLEAFLCRQQRHAFNQRVK
jgi:hypothetical protein